MVCVSFITTLKDLPILPQVSCLKHFHKLFWLSDYPLNPYTQPVFVYAFTHII